MVFWKSFLVLIRFFWLKMQKTTFLKINVVFFLSKMFFFQIKMQAATNWSSHPKKNDRFFMQFSKIAFFRDF